LAMEEPVEVAGVMVHPGDAVLADCDGVVFVPSAELDRVLGLAERIVARERAMAAAVRGGQPVTEVMHDTRFPTVEEAAPRGRDPPPPEHEPHTGDNEETTKTPAPVELDDEPPI
jgi:hypothetical protein